MPDELAEVIEIPKPRCKDRGRHLPSTHPAVWGRDGWTKCSLCGVSLQVTWAEDSTS